MSCPLILLTLILLNMCSQLSKTRNKLSLSNSQMTEMEAANNSLRDEMAKVKVQQIMQHSTYYLLIL